VKSALAQLLDNWRISSGYPTALNKVRLDIWPERIESFNYRPLHAVQIRGD
jgi:hypothetical protein